VKRSDAINEACKKTAEPKATIRLPHRLVASQDGSLRSARREMPGGIDSRTALLAFLEAQLDNLARAVVEALLLDAAGELPVAHLG